MRRPSACSAPQAARHVATYAIAVPLLFFVTRVRARAPGSPPAAFCVRRHDRRGTL